MNISVVNEIDKIWKKAVGNAVIDKLKLELAIQKSLMNFFQVGNFYYYILNFLPNITKVEYISKEMELLLGYTTSEFTLEFYLSKIHPDDIPYFLNFEGHVVSFLTQLPVDKLLKYKMRYDFRVMKSDGSYIRVLHQSVVLEHNDEGQILMSLDFDTDITHLKKEGKPVLSFIGLDGEPSYIDLDVKQTFTIVPEILSNREKEILLHIIEGKENKEIGTLLNISYQTVETHRKNMLRKANVKNSAELIALAIKKGWM